MFAIRRDGDSDSECITLDTCNKTYAVWMRGRGDNLEENKDFIYSNINYYLENAKDVCKERDTILPKNFIGITSDKHSAGISGKTWAVIIVVSIFILGILGCYYKKNKRLLVVVKSIWKKTQLC